MRRAFLGVALALWLATPAHAATRIIYASDWTGPTELFSTRPAGEAGSPHYCDRRPPRLLLEDARDGLVTYVLDGQVDLRRISDGADAVVAPASLARFFDGGLAYAYGARVSIVPFDQLPLRAF